MKTKGFRAFTPTPIYIVGKQVKSMHKQVDRQIPDFLASRKLVRGFTLPELLTAIAIIAILIGVLMPALSQVKRIARETKQKAQIGSIEMGINMYKNDFGEYPPSNGDNLDSINFSYCGAQTLAEAMFGQDLLGFHPDSIYRANGKGQDNTQLYNLTIPSTDPCFVANLNARKGPYLDRVNISVFDPCQIFGKDTYSPGNVVSDRYVICDVFTAVNRSIRGKNYKVGTPILYFRANLSPGYQELTPNVLVAELAKNIYHWRDNYYLINLKRITDGTAHPIWTQSGEKFYGFIGDSKISNLTRPVRPDSFLLISAGSDGLYGTKDDICNFDPNLP